MQWLHSFNLVYMFRPLLHMMYDRTRDLANSEDIFLAVKYCMGVAVELEGHA